MKIYSNLKNGFWSSVLVMEVCGTCLKNGSISWKFTSKEVMNEIIHQIQKVSMYFIRINNVIISIVRCTLSVWGEYGSCWKYLGANFPKTCSRTIHDIVRFYVDPIVPMVFTVSVKNSHRYEYYFVRKFYFSNNNGMLQLNWVYTTRILGCILSFIVTKDCLHIC